MQKVDQSALPTDYQGLLVRYQQDMNEKLIYKGIDRAKLAEAHKAIMRANEIILSLAVDHKVDVAYGSDTSIGMHEEVE